METWTKKEELYKGPIFRLVSGTAVLDTGQPVPRDVVVHNGGVAIVPVLGDDVILIRQFRIAINRKILELPAGRLEGNESATDRAKLELAEEIGYEAGRLVKIADYYASPGFTNERMVLFLAFDLVATEQNLEFDERIVVEKIPLGAIADMLDRQAIIDAKTIIGLRALLAYNQQQREG